MVFVSGQFYISLLDLLLRQTKPTSLPATPNPTHVLRLLLTAKPRKRWSNRKPRLELGFSSGRENLSEDLTEKDDDDDDDDFSLFRSLSRNDQRPPPPFSSQLPFFWNPKKLQLFFQTMQSTLRFLFRHQTNVFDAKNSVETGPLMQQKCQPAKPTVEVWILADHYFEALSSLRQQRWFQIGDDMFCRT